MSGKPANQPAGSGASGNAASSGGASSSAQQDHTSIVLEYLLKRGYHGAAQALRAELDPSSVKPPVLPPQAQQQSAPSSATANAAAGPSQAAQPGQPQQGQLPQQAPGGAIVAGGRSISQEAFEKRQLGPVNSNARLGPNGKPLVREDPMPWRDGLLGLREFVHGSLDIHRPELLPILLPVYFHSIIDLILLGYRDQAEAIFRSFVNDYQATNPSVVNLLSSLKTPNQIFESEQAARWRRERYIVKMTRRGWSLLLGWLQGGSQGLLGHTTQAGEQAERGREKMLGIINERVRVDVVDPKLAPSARLLSGGGLESELATDAAAGPASTSALPPPLKLGPMPIDPKLSKEVQRTLQAQGIAKTQQEAEMQIEGAAASSSSLGDASIATSGSTYAIPPVNQADLPPYPPSFRTIDVKREVEKVKEARKRIRLGPVPSAGQDGKLSVATLGGVSSQAKYNLPSVCMFTLHDTADSLISTEFSEDSSILACGFSESYIRLWNLKGEPLEDTRSDFEPSSMQSSSDLKKLRRSTDGTGVTATTRKLVAHSGPVYSMSFDPLPGPSGPPRYLLSASQDSTVRLWSLDTYTNIVAYRGHRDPVWDVEWGPRGVYFATASRDRTARLWTTERIAAVRIFAGHLSDVDCVRFHPNSLYLATGSSDRTCRLWDVQKGTCVRVFAGHSGAVSTVAISPDGRYLASAGEDANVNLWDLGTSRLIKSMSGHSGRVHSLSFGAESSVLVSGSEDCTVRVWDVQTARTGALSTQSTFTSNTGGAGGREIGERAGEQMNNDLLVTLPTKRTPVYTTKFTPRNLCLAAGPIS